MEFLIPLIGSAFGAALINGFFGIYKIRRDVESEHVQWRRDQRQAEYTKFLNNVFKVQEPLEAVWADDKYPDPQDGDSDPWVGILDAMSVVNNQRDALFLIAPQAVLEISIDVTKELNELAKIAAVTKLNPKTNELRAAWTKTHSRLEHSRTGFLILARRDLGLLTDSKGHDKRLTQTLEHNRAGKERG